MSTALHVGKFAYEHMHKSTLAVIGLIVGGVSGQDFFKPDPMSCHSFPSRACTTNSMGWDVFGLVGAVSPEWAIVSMAVLGGLVGLGIDALARALKTYYDAR